MYDDTDDETASEKGVGERKEQQTQVGELKIQKQIRRISRGVAGGITRVCCM